MRPWLPWLCSALLCAGCATAAPEAATICGTAEPVTVIVASDQYADVVIRDTDAIRLGTATGLTTSRFRFCAKPNMEPKFILDPIGGGIGQVIDGNTTVVPGSTVIFKLGSSLRISFVTVIAP